MNSLKSNINLLRIRNLPDNMEPSEILECFTGVLNEAMQLGIVDPLKTSEALVELSDRQWHTYELIDQDTKIKIESWIELVWDVKFKTLVDDILTIITYLGLENSFRQVENSLTPELDQEIGGLIREAIKELKEHVSDPYYGLK